jgi:hypothetical protein
LADWALTIFFGIISVPIFLDSGAWELDEQGYAMAIDSLFLDNSYLVFTLFFGCLATVIGGYIAAKRACIVHLKHGLYVALVSTIVFFLLPDDDTSAQIPLWYDIASWFLVFPSGLLGGYIAKARQTSPSA